MAIKEEKNLEEIKPDNGKESMIGADESKYCLDLINGWINNADAKIATAFGLFSAVFAAFGYLFGTNMLELKSKCIHVFWISLILASICLFLFVAGLICFFKALLPKLSSEDRKNKYSLFFDEIASFDDKESFLSVCQTTSNDDFKFEVEKEIFYNSKICSVKMKLFRAGLIVSFISILLMIVNYSVSILTILF